jgi:hypothetical protein
MTSFNNSSDQRERRAVIKNDASTLHQFAQSEAGEVGGRFARPATVNASQQAVHYPRVLSGPWADQPGPGPEPSLGVSVEDHEPVGTADEIEASLNAEFGWRKTIRDGAVSTTGPVMPRSSEPAPPATAVNPSSSSGAPPDDGLGKGPLVARGEDKHGKGDWADALSSPNKSKSKPKRRLV